MIIQGRAYESVTLRKRIVLDFFRAESLFWENWLGIRTRATRLPSERSRDAEHKIYTPTVYRIIFQVLRRLPLKDSDVFVDLGCGKGRVVCCAAHLGAARVIGIEYVKEIYEIAAKNAELMRHRRSPITIKHGEAQDHDFTEGTVFYMYNSFGPDTLRTVLSKIEAGLQRNPREIRIAYINPMYGLVVRERKWLERYAFWRHIEVIGLWRSGPVG
jgi:SAM-dependent methyltransferase